MAAAISSGSFRTNGMIVAPYSIKTLLGIATSYADNLRFRATKVGGEIVPEILANTTKPEAA